MKRKLKMDKTKLKKQLTRHQQADEGASVEVAGQLPQEVPAVVVPPKRKHTEEFRWVEDFQISLRHRREGQYLSASQKENPMMLSAYILDEIFGKKGAELPKTIQITVEW